MHRRIGILGALWALFGSALPPAAVAVTVVEVRVATSAGDAEENALGTVSLTSPDLELAYDGGSQTVGMRFPGLAIPRGALILDAWVQFETDETSSGTVSLVFQAEAADNAAAFTTASRNVSSRARALGTVSWIPPPWTSVGEAGTAQRTPNLAALVKAVIDRPGWASGNALVLLATATSTGSSRRTARAWDVDSSGAPLLHVAYDVPAVNNPPALTLLSPAPLTQFESGEGILLSASATDPEEGDLGSRVLWTSNRDGTLGRARSLTVTSLSVGIHTIQASVTDSAGSSKTRTADIQVSAEGRVLVGAGDISSCGNDNDKATAAVLDQTFGTVFTTGDNAYPDGSASNYQTCYEPTWGRHKARTRPAPGNHEYNTTNAVPYFDYFGASAGTPGQGWYSYDAGGWHVVVLNSNCSRIGGCTPTSPQGLWLQADLAAHPRDCTLAMWHHPRFNSGDKHGNQTAMRDFWRILQQNGADVILAGHEHLYERFAPQDADGRADPRGIRQFTVGTGGASHYGFDTTQPNSEVRNDTAWGVLKLTLHDSSYDWNFVPAAGSTFSDSGSASCVVASGPANQPPTAQITAPTNGSTFPQSVPVTFTGSASDPEDGVISSALRWSSDRDGTLGTGGSLTTSALSVGPHTVRATVEDSGGLSAAAQVGVTITQPVTTTFEKRIASGGDDAEEDESTRAVFLGSADLELGQDANSQLVGLRFTALPLPRGARIIAAWVQFEADSAGSTATSLTIQAQAADDAPAFARTDRDLSSRPRTAASVAWAPPSWATGAQGTAQRTPSLAGVLQQVVDRAGWASGNDLVLIVDGSGQRRAQSYEGKSAAAALLHVEYAQP